MAIDFSFKKLVSGLFKNSGGGGSVVGIDIGASAIKVVQLRKKANRAVLESYGEIALGPYAGLELGRATNLPPDKIKEALGDLLREANITARDVGIAIPLSSSLTSLVEMPDLGEKRMAEMIPIEARRYIPVAISEVTLDWWIIPKEDAGLHSPGERPESEKPKDDKNDKSVKKVNVLLVAILNDALEKNRTIVQELDLVDPVYEIELFSTTRSSLDQGIEPVMILDMGAGSTKLYLVEHGIIKDSHIINRGSQDITLSIAESLGMAVEKAEEAKRTIGLSTDPAHRQVSDSISFTLDYVFTEANQMLLSYEKKYNRTISKVVLCGGGAVMRGFAEAAKVHFQASVVAADPFSKTVAPAFLAQTLKIVGPEFAVAVGIALRKLSTNN
jgi:type IV pilus assembly protein PilM